MPRSGTIFIGVDRTLQVAIPLLLAVAALLFGSITPLPAAMVQVACLGIGLLVAVAATLWPEAHRERQDRHTHGLRVAGLLFTMTGLVIAYAWLMVVPLPPFLHRFLSPAYRDMLGAAGTSTLGNRPGMASLNLAPYSGVGAALLLTALAAFSLGCLGHGFSWKALRRLAACFITLVFAVSLLGIVQNLLGGGRILWSALMGDRHPGPFGPFANRNHFATWAVMGALLGVGYFLSMGRRRDPTPTAAGDLQAPARHPAIPAADRNLTAKRALMGFMVIVIVAALILSQSRGGIISLFAGLAGMSLLLGTRRRFRGSWKVLVIVLPALLVAVWLGIDPLLDKLKSTAPGVAPGVGDEARGALTRDLLRIISDHPWLGIGPGAFGEVYPLYQTAAPEYHYTYAHNDWLQLLAEWGLVGTALFAVLTGVYWRKLLSRWRRRRNSEILFLSAGAAGGVLAVMVHALLDFSLRIPAVALAFLFLAVLALKVVDARPEGSVAGRMPNE